MRDPNLFLLLAGALIVFAAIAFYVEAATTHLSRKTGTKPPHRMLVQVTRIWFSVLALACLLLLLLPLFGSRH